MPSKILEKNLSRRISRRKLTICIWKIFFSHCYLLQHHLGSKWHEFILDIFWTFLCSARWFICYINLQLLSFKYIQHLNLFGFHWYNHRYYYSDTNKLFICQRGKLIMDTVITRSDFCVCRIKSKNNHANLLYIKSDFEVQLLFGLKLYLFLSFELVPNKQKRIWITKVSLQFWAVRRFWSRFSFLWNCFIWKLFNENKQRIW